MTSRRDVLGAAAAAGGLLLPGSALLARSGGAIRRATAITEVFGEGQKLTAVALDYGVRIDAAALSGASFAVEGRTVTDVYPATAADPAARAPSGTHVVIALARDDAAAALRLPGGGGGGGPPSATGAAGAPSASDAAGGAALPRTLGAGPPRGAMFRHPEAVVTQMQPLRTSTGAVIAPAAAPIRTSAVRNLIVDDFRQFEFRDPLTGDVLKYNLFVPAGYDGRRSYPLVLFMHDAGEIGGNTTATLQQGLGAVVWAGPAEQARRPCFVLAPAYPTPMFIRSTYATSLLDTTVHLIERLRRRYRIDPDRLYATGQSAGGMMSLAANIKYPDLFAASFVVAGEWNPALVKPLAGKKLWIVVSEGDEKAFPTENAIMTVLEGEGATIARGTWDGRSTAAQFGPAVASMTAAAAPINYAVLRRGTVVPEGQRDNGGGNHVNTWRIAYTVEGVREWLFRQRR